MSYGGCVGGLKSMRARGSLAKAVSGYSYSRRSQGSGTEGVCIQRMWYCMLHPGRSYLEGLKAAEVPEAGTWRYFVVMSCGAGGCLAPYSWLMCRPNQRHNLLKMAAVMGQGPSWMPGARAPG